jgi:ComF family protein
MLKHIINLFFPEICAGCDALLLTGEQIICSHCRHEIPLTFHHLNRKNEATDKFYGRLPVEFVGTMAYFHKNGVVQKIIHKLKYQGQQRIGTAMGIWYAADLLAGSPLKPVDAVIPVPLHRKRLKMRGYNQVTTFAQALSDALPASYRDDILIRTVYSKTQTKKNLLNRNSASRDLFEVAFAETDCHKHYLIVDDVLTTGATLEACGRAMLKIPGATISIVCMAMSKT